MAWKVQGQLDLAMPGGNGLELARQPRQLFQTKNALLICVSAYGTEKDRQESHTAGFEPSPAQADQLDGASTTGGAAHWAGLPIVSLRRGLRLARSIKTHFGESP